LATRETAARHVDARRRSGKADTSERLLRNDVGMGKLAGKIVPGNHRTQRIALGVLTTLTFLVVAWMAAPMLVGLVLGTVLGFTAQPMYTRLTARMRQRRTLAAALTTFLGGLVMVGGGVGIVWIAVREVIAAVGLLQHELAAGGLGPLGARIASLAAKAGVPQDLVASRLRDGLGRLGNLLAQGAGFVLEASASAVLTIIIALWTMFYIVRDWPNMARHLERLLPLDPRHTRALVAEFRRVGRQSFIGNIGTAIVQGGLAGVGFFIFGVPQAVTWAVLLAVMSFIPVVGTLIVWIPATGWLLTQGQPARAVLLAAWCILFVLATSDYVVRPRLVGREGAHPLLTLIALIGGIAVFGVAGIFLGPVMVSLFLASAHIYELEREADHKHDVEQARAEKASEAGKPRADEARSPT
jgi:predicted PurR-regulated permease PerM